MYARSHLVVVPTRSDFCEGLPMVCAEAVLAGRPVVTSSLSNALEALEGAVIVARENDPSDYADKIREVARDPALYARLVSQTRRVASQFLDRSRGLESAIRQCFELTVPDRGSFATAERAHRG